MPLRPLMARNLVVDAYSAGAATGVVTQVERILPNLLEVDRMGVTMVDPSGAEVTLRDLLVMEDPDIEDPAGTTVVLLALREADPEETALYAPKFDSVDRTIPLEHFLAQFNIIQKKYGLNDTQVVRIFDDCLTSCGRTSLLGGGSGGFPEGVHSEDTESKDGRDY
ncbi:hypothetical protein DYB26_016548 [Aphanomyces astaci]|uniref:Uncharacterized protein n=1 Tax=Aphanomyces astaci TaxID=112090 RepID=A0A3R7A4S9_APHAT|nr:hypothetical protein DYB26_016548 [Aphanomyces astaci]